MFMKLQLLAFRNLRNPPLAAYGLTLRRSLVSLVSSSCSRPKGVGGRVAEWSGRQTTKGSRVQ